MKTHNFIAIAVLAAIITALMAVRWAYFKILYVAKEKKLVDNPDARKLQKEPIPVMGGIAVFFGVVRLIDIIKPPPVKRLQSLPGGRGIVVDDLVANLYALAVNWIIFALIMPGT